MRHMAAIASGQAALAHWLVVLEHGIGDEHPLYDLLTAGRHTAAGRSSYKILKYQHSGFYRNKIEHRSSCPE
ncbi:hypothetical protein Plhal304r1_c072g0160461 [Plasmopara halstedii]